MLGHALGAILEELMLCSFRLQKFTNLELPAFSKNNNTATYACCDLLPVLKEYLKRFYGKHYGGQAP